MKINMGVADKIIRIVVALVLIILYATNMINGVLGIILVSLAIIFLLTSLISRCPLYLPLRINTEKKEKAQ